MAETTRLTLPLIAAAQAQKHVTHNEAIMRLDGLVQMTAKSYTTSAQPGSPADGDLYLLPAGKTGSDWGSYSNHAVAHYYDGVWHQYHPNQGWLCFVQDTGYLYYYTGSQWALVPATGIADGSVSAPGLAGSSDSNSGLYKIGADNWGVAMGGSKVVDWKQAGNTQPLQPCFLAGTAGHNDVTGDGTSYTAIFENKAFDQGNNYNASTGIFTAPVTGKYLFSATIDLSGLVSSNSISILLAGKGYIFYGSAAALASTEFLMTAAKIVALSASDTTSITITVSGGTKVVDIGNAAQFAGCLLA